MTYLPNDVLQIPGVPLPILVRNRPQLVIVPGAEYTAHLHLVRPHPALRGIVYVAHVPLDVRLVDRRRVLSALRLQHDHKVSLRLHAQVAAYYVLQLPSEDVFIRRLDSLNIRVGPAEEDVVKHLLLGPRPVGGVVQQVHVVQQGALHQGHKPLLEPRTRLALDVGFEVAPVDAMVGFADGDDLQRVLVRQYADQRLLVCAESLHRRPQRLRIAVAAPLDGLRRPVSERRRRGRIVAV